MKKPSKKRVIAAIQQDKERGKRRYLEGVTFDSGYSVITYEAKAPVPNLKQDHVQVRLLVVDPSGNTTSASILDSWFERYET